jgi:hypothetical protein
LYFNNIKHTFFELTLKAIFNFIVNFITVLQITVEKHLLSTYAKYIHSNAVRLQPACVHDRSVDGSKNADVSRGTRQATSRNKICQKDANTIGKKSNEIHHIM